MTLAATLRARIDRIQAALRRGRDHRARLAAVNVRIAVTGTRGKSSLVTWLAEVFTDRGYDTYAKVTGEIPHSIYNGVHYPIERHGPVMLYETERELRRFDPQDVIVVENQGIREYTGRLVNHDYVDATLVVVTNVRRDHLDTLGTNYRAIARGLARSVPDGIHVVSGERNPVVNDYLERELARRNATLTRAVGPDVEPVPAAELLALVEAVLAAVGEAPLDDVTRAAFRDRLRVEWTQLPEGRVYNAANVNDVDSTELVRRALQGEHPEPFTPLVYLRHDRPGRSATYVRYLNWLAEQGLVETVHHVGAHREAVERKLTVPVVAHDERAETPTEVLDAAFTAGRPVVVMGNTVPAFMQELALEIERRAEAVAPALVAWHEEDALVVAVDGSSAGPDDQRPDRLVAPVDER
jgi:hypothetical protein